MVKYGGIEGDDCFSPMKPKKKDKNLEFEYTMVLEHAEPEVEAKVTIEFEFPADYTPIGDGDARWKTVTKKASKSAVKVPWKGYLMQDGEKYDMAFDNFQIDGDWALYGDGADDFGKFEMDGTCDDKGHCEFTKQYIGAHSVYYKGEFNGRRIRGKWNIPDQSPDDFEIKMDPQSWHGAFWQDAEKYPMALDMVINKDGVYGSGKDTVGTFVCHGGSKSDDVWFCKSYLGQHQVNYFGQWVDDSNILGTWTITGTGSNGPFRLALQ